MSEQKESSVLFSLKELMNLEEDRIRGEEEGREHQRRVEEETRMAAEKAARDAEEARIRAEEERRRAEELRGREEAARLEAIRHAEVEKARVEAEQQARLAAMSTQQSHERQLAAINQDKGKKNLRNILIGLSAAVLIGGSITAVLVYQSHERSEAERIRLEADAQQARKDKEALEQKLQSQGDAVKNLEASLAGEKDERKKAELQQQLSEAKRDQEDTQKKLGGPAVRRTGPGDSTPTKAPCNCKPTDPLCDCL